MRAAARPLFTVGLSLLAAGFGAIALVFAQRLWEELPVFRQSLDLDAGFESGPLELPPEGARLAVQLSFSTRAVGEQISPRGSLGKLDLFRLPVHFQVIGQKGETLFSQAVTADAVGERLVRPGLEPRARPALHTRRVLTDPFRPGEKPAQLAVTLMPDETFGAQLERATLLVLREPAPVLPGLLLGLQLAAAGLGFLLLGLLAELVPALMAARAARPRAVSRQAAGARVIGRISPAAPAPQWRQPALQARRQAF